MPAPKDPEKFAQFREKMRQIALERGYGKWMAGRPVYQSILEKNHARKGKTYEELYGEERAQQERESRKLSNKRAKEGQRPPHLIELQKEIAKEWKGKTYAEIYGDGADEESAKRRDAHRKRWEEKPKKAGRRPKHNGDYRYTDWRKAVFERDNYTCQHCQQRGQALQAHHIRSWSKFPDLHYEVVNGLTLCKSCHAIANREQRIAERNLENEGKEEAG